MEIWKEVKGYEGIYEISNLGNVKSLSRLIIKGAISFLSKEKILKQGINSAGYFHIVLSLNGNTKTKTIHKLVAEAFLNHNPNGYEMVVNHKNFDKLDNRVENLELVTARENCNKKHLKSTSRFTGVGWHKNVNKWTAQIYINGKLRYLGYFTNEIEASNAYQNALKKL